MKKHNKMILKRRSPHTLQRPPAQAICTSAVMSIHLNDAINHQGFIHDTNILPHNAGTSNSFIFLIVSVYTEAAITCNKDRFMVVWSPFPLLGL